MSPTLSSINQVALQPYLKGDITQTEALEKAADPMKKFMFSHTREKDLLLFMKYNQTEKPSTYQDIPITVMVPAYAISELKTAFQMGFMIFIPFPRNRHCSCEYTHGYGDDDASTCHDLVTFQNTAICTC